MARRTSEQVKADEALIEEIKQSLQTNPKAVCRAIMLLQRNQTADERTAHATLQRNNVGFTMVDADFGAFLAGVIAREHTLRGSLLEKGRKMTMKYARTQLFAAAKERRNGKSHG